MRGCGKVAARDWRGKRREGRNLYFFGCVERAGGRGDADGVAVLTALGATEVNYRGDEINLVSMLYTISRIHDKGKGVIL